MENTNYRETASFKEYEDIRKLLEQEKTKVKALNVGGHIMRGVGWFAATVSVLYVIGMLFWFAAIRGTAYGEAARHNSEREATNFATRVLGPNVQFRVVCSEYSIDGNVQNCLVTREGKNPFNLHCDDDDPVTNDGCRIKSLEDL